MCYNFVPHNKKQYTKKNTGFVFLRYALKRD